MVTPLIRPIHFRLGITALLSSCRACQSVVHKLIQAETYTTECLRVEDYALLIYVIDSRIFHTALASGVNVQSYIL
jgi:hypothetical protein